MSMKKSKKYSENVEPRLEETKEWRKEGLLRAEIAERLGVSLWLLVQQQRQHQVLYDALNTAPQLTAAEEVLKEQKQERYRSTRYSSVKSFIKLTATPEEKREIHRLIYEYSTLEEQGQLLKDSEAIRVAQQENLE